MSRKFESGAVRDTNDGKGRFDCIDMTCFDAMDDDIIRTIANIKYRLENNWIEDASVLCRKVIKQLVDKEGYNAILHMGKVAQTGAEKYGKGNWQKGIPCSSFIDSTIRHWCKYQSGWQDEDHLGSTLWNLMALHWTIENKPECNDLYEVDEK